MEVSKHFLGPQVDATFPRIAMGQFDDGNTLRPEEQKQGNDPEPDGDATVGGDGGEDIEIEDGDDKEENEVAAAENALQMRLRRSRSSRRRGSVHRDLIRAHAETPDAKG